MTEDEMHEMFGDANPFSDFFHTFFGGGGASGEEPRGRTDARHAPRAARQAATSSRRLELGLEDAVSRHDAPLRRSRTTARRARSTSGFRPASATARASASPAKASRAPAARSRAISICGSGSRRIRQFERKGTDLYTRVPMPLTTAVLGGEAEVQTLGGKSLRLKIPPTTQNGQVFRLKGHGMPAVGKPDEHGDLYATVDVAAATRADAGAARRTSRRCRSWRRGRRTRRPENSSSGSANA